MGDVTYAGGMTMTTPSPLGERLRELREAHHWSQAALACRRRRRVEDDRPPRRRGLEGDGGRVRRPARGESDRVLRSGEVILDMLYDVTMPTPVQRRRIGGVVEGSSALQQTGGHAVVTNSTLGRSLMTAINWVVRPSFEERIFGCPQEALEWLREKNPGVDRRRCSGPCPRSLR